MTAYGNVTNNWRAYLNAWEASRTETTLTISATGGFAAYNWGFDISSGVSTSITCSHAGGTGSGSGGAWSSYGGWEETQRASGTWTVPRGSTGYYATIYCTTTNASGYMNGTSSCSATVWVPPISYRKPHNPTNVAASRVSDNKNTLSWSQDGTGMDGLYPWGGFCIDRRVDGGEWSRIASIDSYSTHSYADTTTSPDHSYQYRVSTYGPGGTSGSVSTGVLYNTPSAPSFGSIARKTATIVTVNLDNASKTATGLDVQVSTDGAAWGETSKFAGKVTTFDIELGGGTFYLRARNTRGAMASAWSKKSDQVVTICAPKAPALTAPASSAVVSKATENISFTWKHSPIDGSAQTAAQLRYSTNGGTTWTTVDVTGGAQSKSVANAFAVNSTVTWSVRTKGAHADYGPWAGNRVFQVKQVPTVYFSAPASGAVVGEMPIAVVLSYSDPSGALANAKLELQHSGSTVWSKDMGNATAATIGAADFLPTNGESYTLKATVRSSSQLQATAVRTIEIDFIEPERAYLVIDPDPDTGHVAITAKIAEDESLATATRIQLFRVYKDSRICIADDTSGGVTITDKYAPLNVDYSYEAVTFAESGSFHTSSFEGRIETPWWFVYFSDGIARAMWEPAGDIDQGRPNDELVYFDGREWPVLFQTRNKSDERSFGGWVDTQEEADLFGAMSLAAGDKVYKSLKGDVFHCRASAKITPDYEYGEDGADISVSITRIDGGDL